MFSGLKNTFLNISRFACLRYAAQQLVLSDERCSVVARADTIANSSQEQSKGFEGVFKDWKQGKHVQLKCQLMLDGYSLTSKRRVAVGKVGRAINGIHHPKVL
eukprot:scaffold7754_cov17-Tisochrysis_lutea.AAC.1